MKRILSILLVLSLLLPCVAFADEAPEEERAKGCVYLEDDPSRCVTFSYPAQYTTRSSTSFGYVNVYYDDDQYVAIWLMPASISASTPLSHRYNKRWYIDTLTDQMFMAGKLRDTLYTPACNILEANITLEQGYFIIVQAFTISGHLEAYDLYLDIIGNFVDTELVENWLNEVWYPQVLAAEEDQ